MNLNGSMRSSNPSNNLKARYGRFLTVCNKPEGGLQDGNYFCQVCEINAGGQEEQWITHLLSPSHLNVHRVDQHLRKILWDLDKTVEIKIVRGTSSSYILRYILACGDSVADFSYLRKVDGKTDSCHALMVNKESVAKLTNPMISHHIGPKRHAAKIINIPDKWKKKWGQWRNKILTGSNDPTEDSMEDDEIIVLDEDEDEGDDDLASQASCDSKDLESSKKRKFDATVDRKFGCLHGLKLEDQFEKLRAEIGWSEDFLTKSIPIVDAIVSSYNIKYKKFPFGDITTGMGYKYRPALQLIVDVQEILEKKSNAAKAMINSMTSNFQQSVDSLNLQDLKYEHLQLKKIWTTECSDTEVCVSILTQQGLETELKLKFGNTLPLQECKLFKFYCDLDVRVEDLGFLLTHWAASNNILVNSKQPYPNQFILLLILFYLQHKKVIPTVQKLQENFTGTLQIINKNIVSFCSDLGTVRKIHPNPSGSLLEDKSIRSLSVLGLLKDWFEFFGTIDLKENAICTRFGYLVGKKDFHPDFVGKLPGDLCRVYRFGMTSETKVNENDGNSGNTKKFLCSLTPLCIQNPFELSMNCSRGVTPAEVAMFQKKCQEAVTVVNDILISDTPDLAEFLTKTTDTSEIPNKRVKQEQPVLSSATVSPKSKPESTVISLPAKIQQPTVVTVASSTPSQLSSAKSSPSVSNQSNNSLSTSPRGNKAADYFNDVDLEEEADDDEDDSEDAGLEDISATSDSASAIALNFPLFEYFEHTYKGTREMKYQKIQLLILQYILEFNQKFWTSCLGLVFEPKVGQKFWADDFSRLNGQGQVKTGETVEQRAAAISDREKEINVSFRVRSDGKLIHKIFLEDNLTMKRCGVGGKLTEFSLLLYEEVPDTRLTEIRDSVFVQSAQTASDQQIVFECRLNGSISSAFNTRVNMVTLTIDAKVGNSNQNNARIQFLKSLFRKLGQSYINKMVKRWLYEGKDFDQAKADNYVTSRIHKWNRKKNRKEKAKLKKEQKELLSHQQIPQNNRKPLPPQPIRAMPNVLSRPSRTTMPTNTNFQPRGNSFRPNLNSSNPRPPRPRMQNNSQQRFLRPMPSYNEQRFQNFQPQNMSAGAGRNLLRPTNPPAPQNSSFQNPNQFRFQTPQQPRGLLNTPPPQQYQHQLRGPRPMDSAPQQTQERILRNPGMPGARVRAFQPPQPQLSPPRYTAQNESRPLMGLLPKPPFDYGHNDNSRIPNAPGDTQHNSNKFEERERQGTNQNWPPQPPSRDFDFEMRHNHKDAEWKNDNLPQGNQFRQDVHHEGRQRMLEPLLPNPRYNQNQRFPEPKNYDRQDNSQNIRVPLPSLYDQLPSESTPRTDFEEKYGSKRTNMSNSAITPLFPRGSSPQPNRYQPPYQEQNYSGARQGPSINVSGFNPRSQAERAPEGHFISGGYLTAGRGNESEILDDDDLDIVWDLNPKGSSSPPPPPPPPLRNYKVGAPYPVPTKNNTRSPISNVSRNIVGYRTRTLSDEGPSYTTTAGLDSEEYGYTSVRTASRSRNNSQGEHERLVSSYEFEGFGINASGINRYARPDNNDADEYNYNTQRSGRLF